MSESLSPGVNVPSVLESSLPEHGTISQDKDKTEGSEAISTSVDMEKTGEAVITSQNLEKIEESETVGTSKAVEKSETTCQDIEKTEESEAVSAAEDIEITEEPELVSILEASEDSFTEGSIHIRVSEPFSLTENLELYVTDSISEEETVKIVDRVSEPQLKDQNKNQEKYLEPEEEILKEVNSTTFEAFDPRTSDVNFVDSDVPKDITSILKPCSVIITNLESKDKRPSNINQIIDIKNQQPIKRRGRPPKSKQKNEFSGLLDSNLSNQKLKRPRIEEIESPVNIESAKINKPKNNSISTIDQTIPDEYCKGKYEKQELISGTSYDSSTKSVKILSPNYLINQTLAKLMNSQSPRSLQKACNKKEKVTNTNSDTLKASSIKKIHKDELSDQRFAGNSKSEPSKNFNLGLEEPSTQSSTIAVNVLTARESFATNGSENEKLKEKTYSGEIKISSNNILNEDCKRLLNSGKSSNKPHSVTVVTPRELINRTLEKLTSRKFPQPKPKPPVEEEDVTILKSNNLSEEQIIEKIKNEEKQRELIALTLARLTGGNRPKSKIKTSEEEKIQTNDPLVEPDIKNSVEEKVLKISPCPTLRTVIPRESKTRAKIYIPPKRKSKTKDKVNSSTSAGMLQIEEIKKEGGSQKAIFEENLELQNQTPITQNGSYKTKIEKEDEIKDKTCSKLNLLTSSESKLRSGKFIQKKIKTSVKKEKCCNGTEVVLQNEKSKMEVSTRDIPADGEELGIDNQSVLSPNKNQLDEQNDKSFPTVSGVTCTVSKLQRCRRRKFKKPNLKTTKIKNNNYSKELRLNKNKKDKSLQQMKEEILRKRVKSKSSNVLLKNKEGKGNSKCNVPSSNLPKELPLSKIKEDKSLQQIKDDILGKGVESKSNNVVLKNEKDKGNSKFNVPSCNLPKELPLSKIEEDKSLLQIKDDILGKGVESKSNNVVLQNKECKLNPKLDGQSSKSSTPITHTGSNSVNGISSKLAESTFEEERQVKYNNSSQTPPRDQFSKEEQMGNPVVCLVDYKRVGGCVTDEEVLSKNTVQGDSQQRIKIASNTPNQKNSNNIMINSGEYLFQLELSPSSKSPTFANTTLNSSTTKNCGVEKGLQIIEIVTIDDDDNEQAQNAEGSKQCSLGSSQKTVLVENRTVRSGTPGTHQDSGVVIDPNTDNQLEDYSSNEKYCKSDATKPSSPIKRVVNTFSLLTPPQKGIDVCHAVQFPISSAAQQQSVQNTHSRKTQQTSQSIQLQTMSPSFTQQTMNNIFTGPVTHATPVKKTPAEISTQSISRHKNIPSNSCSSRKDKSVTILPKIPISATVHDQRNQSTPSGPKNYYFTPLFVLDGQKVVPINSSNFSKYSIGNNNTSLSQLKPGHKSCNPVVTEMLQPSFSPQPKETLYSQVVVNSKSLKALPVPTLVPISAPSNVSPNLNLLSKSTSSSSLCKKNYGISGRVSESFTVSSTQHITKNIEPSIKMKQGCSSRTNTQNYDFHQGVIHYSSSTKTWIETDPTTSKRIKLQTHDETKHVSFDKNKIKNPGPPIKRKIQSSLKTISNESLQHTAGVSASLSTHPIIECEKSTYLKRRRYEEHDQTNDTPKTSEGMSKVSSSNCCALNPSDEKLGSLNGNKSTFEDEMTVSTSLNENEQLGCNKNKSNLTKEESLKNKNKQVKNMEENASSLSGSKGAAQEKVSLSFLQENESSHKKENQRVKSKENTILRKDKKMRVKSKEEELEECLDGVPPFIQEVFKCENIRHGFDNRDLIFVLSLLPDIEEMTNSQRVMFQLRAINLLNDVFTSVKPQTGIKSIET